MDCRVPRFALGAFLASTLASTASGQISTGKLFGLVRDGTGAVLPGAAVKLSSDALLPGSAETTANERGEFRYLGLSPGDYTLEVSHRGFRPYRGESLRVEAGGSIELDVTLSLGIEEQVTVVDERPLVDPRQSGISTSYGQEMQEQIPRLRSDFLDFIKMAPGISATRPTGGAFALVSAFGSGVNENLFFIDGFDQTDPHSGQDLPFLSTDSVQEVEIVTNGASAEFGNYQGAVFNVVTRQGSNDWRFDASYYQQSDRWAATGPNLDCGCPAGETGFNNLQKLDATAQVEGPLLRDRLWVLGNFQYRRHQENWAGSDPAYVPVGWEKRFFEKLSFQATPNLTFRQTYQDGHNRYPDSSDAFFPAQEVGVSWWERGPVLGMGASYLRGANTLVDATFTGSFKSYGGDPLNGSRSAPPHYDLATGKWSGGAYLFGRSWTDRVSINGKVTRYADEFLGASHEFKFGLQFTNGSDRWFYGYPGGVSYTDYAGEPYLAYLWGTETQGSVVRRVGFFAEDVVEVGERLTLNLGLRLDRNTSESPDIPAVDVVGEETGETIEGLGHQFAWNVASPRLGFTLALDREARTVLRGSFGRFYQGIFAGEFEFHPGNSISTTALFNPATGTYSTILSVFDPAAQEGFDPDVRAPYTDQLSIGLDREVFEDASFGVSYVRKDGKRYTGWKDIGGIYGTATATLPDGRTLTVYPLLNSTSDRYFLLTNREDFYLDYQGLILTFQKRWARKWQAMLSYTLSESTGLQGSTFRAAGGPQDSSGGFLNRGRDPNEFINAEGSLTGDRTHMFRVQASTEVPRLGVVVGASYQYLSGVPWAAAAVVRLPQGPTGIFIEPRGSQRMPNQNLLDLRLSKAFTFDRGRRIEILIDVLNALNEDANERVATTNYFSPSFADGREFVRPRRAMIGIRASF